MKCLNKILKPTSGRILIDGEDVEGMSYKDVSKLVGYVPTSSEDAFSMPVFDAILIGRYNHHHWGSEEKDLEMVYKAMELMHIRGLASKGFNELSAGQHQKALIARGLVQDTPVLILDEPTSNLDVKYQIYVSELLRAMAEFHNMIIIMISHDLNITARYSNQIIMMSRPGIVYRMGIPSEVLTVENIQAVYGIDCRIFDDNGAPHIVLGKARIDEDCDDYCAGTHQNTTLLKLKRPWKNRRVHISDNGNERGE